MEKWGLKMTQQTLSNIIIVDDDPDILSQMVKIFSKLNILNVKTFTAGQDVIQELENSTLSVAENEKIWNKKIKEVEIESLAIQEAEAKTEQDIRKIVEKLLENKKLSLEETTF